jgi:hypothetical protein
MVNGAVNATEELFLNVPPFRVISLELFMLPAAVSSNVPAEIVVVPL